MTWDGKTERRSDNNAMLQWLAEFGTELRKDVKDSLDTLKEDLKEDINKIEDGVKEVRDEVSELKSHVGEIDTKMAGFEVQVFNENTGIISKVNDHHKILKGNGKKGLIDEFNCLSQELTILKTKIYTSLAIAGGAGAFIGWMIHTIIAFYK